MTLRTGGNDAISRNDQAIGAVRAVTRRVLAGGCDRSRAEIVVDEQDCPTVADDFIIAVILGLVVMLYERRRQRYLEARLKVIREMNHHVRNALQVLSYTAMQQADDKVRNMMRESVTRIDWALREVLPSDDAVD